MKQPRIETVADWEVSPEPDESNDGIDVLLDDVGNDEAPNSSRSVPNEFGTFAKKLESLNRKIPMGALKTAAQVTAATTPGGIPVDRFEEGDMVVHPSYGSGRITSVEGRGLRRMGPRCVLGRGAQVVSAQQSAFDS